MHLVHIYTLKNKQLIKKQSSIYNISVKIKVPISILILASNNRYNLLSTASWPNERIFVCMYK